MSKVKLTADQLLIAMTHVSTIIRERRPMPQRGKIAFARMHSALMSDYTIIAKERDDLVKSYDYHPVVKVAATPADGEEAMARGWVERPHDEFAVPEDKIKEFEEKWKETGDTVLEIEVTPISAKLFDLGTGTDGSIHAFEIIEMRDLITE